MSLTRATTPLTGRRVVVTAGGTREPIDPVRYLGNRSTGKMGNAVCQVAADRGAEVVLVTAAPPPPDPRVSVISVETAEQMHASLREVLPGAAALIMAAAVSDYRPRTASPRKLKKTAAGLTLELIPTVDILGALSTDEVRRGVLMVGFAAETDDLEANAARKLAEKDLHLVVLNDVGRPEIGMASDDNAVTIFDVHGIVGRISRRPKKEVAAAILDLVENRL